LRANLGTLEATIAAAIARGVEVRGKPDVVGAASRCGDQRWRRRS
jgi:hypothetical protein